MRRRVQAREHIDLRMSANNKPNGDLIANLIRLLARAPKPLLLYCGGDSDRSGLAALYELEVDGGPAGACRDPAIVQLRPLSVALGRNGRN